MQIKELIGRTITRIVNEGSVLKFYMKTGPHVIMYHEQDCCEDVRIEDICGDLEDLLDTPILRAEERYHSKKEKYGDLSEWTFYEVATIKGSVTIRWYGESNGYYSTAISIEYF